MAGLRAVFSFEGVSTPTSGDVCLVYVVAPTNQRVRVIRVEASVLQSIGSDPLISYSLGKFSTAGTGGNSVTAFKPNGEAETVQSTAKSGGGGSPFSVQPTISGKGRVLPLYPSYTYSDRPEWLFAGGGERVGIIINRNASSTSTVTFSGEIEIEE